ncbi:MAG: hypothetical protein LC792_20160 [Actinobacteria bacterium]|nr:hypothetical protein [Actinomycetota bacterium]
MPAAAGVVLLVGSLVLGRARPVGPAVALLGVGYVLSTIGRPLDPDAVLYAVGLLAVAELGFWSLELPRAAGPPPGGDRHRWAFIAGGVAASVMLGGAVLVAGTVSLAGAGWEVAAGMGTIGVAGLLTGLAFGQRRPASDGPHAAAGVPPG